MGQCKKYQILFMKLLFRAHFFCLFLTLETQPNITQNMQDTNISCQVIKAASTPPLIQQLAFVFVISPPLFPFPSICQLERKGDV